MKAIQIAVLGAVALSCANAGTIQYFTSDTGESWGVSDFTNAMSTVFGTYSTQFFETADASVFNPGTSFVFMEGGAANDAPLQSYLTANSSAISDWVNNGGRLMIDSAGWDNDIDTGIGDVVLSVNQFSSNGFAVGSSNPVFAGPFGTVSTALSGDSFSHDIVTGTGLTALVTGDAGTVTAYESFGSGLVLFSGQTAPNFQNPQPDSFNLLNNELAFASGGVSPAPEPASLALIGAGVAFFAFRRRRLTR